MEKKMGDESLMNSMQLRELNDRDSSLFLPSSPVGAGAFASTGCPPITMLVAAGAAPVGGPPEVDRKWRKIPGKSYLTPVFHRSR